MLTNKVIVVTGGLGTIGKVFVEGIREAGGIPIIADVGIAGNTQINQLSEIELNGTFFDSIKLDITNKTSVEGLISAAVSKHGRVDVLVNNAYPRNSRYGRKLEDVEYSDFCENISTHLGGYFLVSQAFAKQFNEQGHGNIINMASIYGVSAPKFDIYAGTKMTMPVEYAAIKSAVIHLTKYFAEYFKGSGIRVNCISPGGVFANQDDKFLGAYKLRCASKGMLDAKDITGALLFLASDLSKYVNGQNIIVDDGWTL